MEEQIYIVTYIYPDEDDSSYKVKSHTEAVNEIHNLVSDMSKEEPEMQYRLDESVKGNHFQIVSEVDNSVYCKIYISKLYT